jgi:hypothetical protein
MRAAPALVTVALAAGLALASAAACSDDTSLSPVATEAGPPPAIPRPNTDDPTILAGWNAVLRRDCARCHEPPDANAGILSGGIAPVAGTMAWAKNLTPDPDTGLDAWDASTVVRALRTGVDDGDQPLCETMPRFADMGDDEGHAIAVYLQSLTAVHHYVPDSVCPPLKTGDTDAGGTDADTADGGAGDAPDDAPADG